MGFASHLDLHALMCLRSTIAKGTVVLVIPRSLNAQEQTNNY